MDQLSESILELNREQVMEATRALRKPLESAVASGGEPTGESEAGAGDAETMIATWLDDVNSSPESHIAEVEELARVILLWAAAQPQLSADVTEAVEGVGQRAFIFGGLEIVALAALGVYVFNSIQSHGIATTEEETEIKPDGTKRHKKKVVYLAKSGVTSKIFGAIAQGGAQN